jgi:AcrR family transcriptional regulator
MDELFTGKKAQSHQRIVAAASKSVRRAGFHGVGVADIMKEAGLTHGGFYAHFASRDALLSEALAFASKEIGTRIRANVQRLAHAGESPFHAFVETYLSDGQLVDCENGCPVAALCNAMPLQAPAVVDASRQIVINLHRLVLEVMPDGASDGAAWSVASSLIGAMQLARALGDNDQGRAVLAAARADLVDRYDK